MLHLKLFEEDPEEENNIPKPVSLCHLQIGGGSWYHFTGTYDGSTFRVYVNGEEKGSAAAEGSINAAGENDLFLGVGERNRHFNGVIDEVMMWNRALSESEIKQLFELQGGK